MPTQQQTFSVPSTDKESVLLICYSAFMQLGWEVQFAGEEKILAATPKKWNTNSQQIIVEAGNACLTISSEMNKGESFDMTGRNRKNISAFWSAFEKCRQSITTDTLQSNAGIIAALREKTKEVAEQEAKEAAEVDAVMNLSTSNLYITYAVIGINILVFILMAVNGAGIFEANGLVHIKWGSNFGPLTKSGDWWRLLTCVFIHFGIIHLLMNMYCLYSIGVYLEPMLGKVRYITAYLCTGVFASLTSLWWHTEAKNSAGASGAVFGMYGLFLALLTTNLIPARVRQALLQSIGIFVVYNLVYGLKSGVDNAAHVGGLISGFIIGYAYAFSIKKEKTQHKIQWIVPVVIVMTGAGAFAYLQQNKTEQADRKAILTELDAAGYKDNAKFTDKLNNFAAEEEKAIAVLTNSDSLSRTEYVQKLKEALAFWDNAKNGLDATAGYNISEASHKKAAKLNEYIQLRKEEFNYLISLNSSLTVNEIVKQKLDEVEIKLSKILEELKTL